MSGRGGGGRGGYGGRGRDRGRDRGRGRFGGGRGGGRGDFRAMPEAEGRRQVEQIASSFRIGQPCISESVDRPDAPSYPPGTIGTQAQLAANYFQVECQLSSAFQYNVTIECEFNQGLEHLLVEELAKKESWPPGWIFDGKNALYTAGQIISTDEREETVELEQGPRRRQYKIKLTQTTVVRMSHLTEYVQRHRAEFPAEPVRVLEILLSHAASLMPNRILHRRSVFVDAPANKHDIGHGAEAWLGYHQSIRPCQNGLFLNIDSACAPFYKPMLVSDFIAEILGQQHVPRDLTHQQRSIVKGVMKNLTVSLVRGRMRKKVVGLLDPPTRLSFDHREHGEISVAEYYRRMDCPLRYPELPCLDCSRGRKICYVPPEYARIAHAQFVNKITERHQEQMIRLAAQRPDDKERYLNGLIRQDADINQMQKVPDFQLSALEPAMKQIRGRVLPSPFLAYKEPACLDVGTEGQWNLGGMTMNFFKAKKLKSWALLSLAQERFINRPGENGIQAFLHELYEALRAHTVIPSSVDLSRPPIVYTSDSNFIQDMEQAKARAREAYGRDPDIILCLIPRRNTRLYKIVKRTSDVHVGIPTQCFAGDKSGVGDNRPPRGRPQYCANLALKINVKVGGTNSVLLGTTHCGLPMVHQRRPYIVMGADVSHASPGSHLPSIAAVVGSVDPMASRYSSRITSQPPREEIIIDMKESVKGLLRDFYEHNHQKRPESIVMFRDGVSEGFFSRVLTHEYKAIREACGEMGDPDADYAPPVTYIIIQKRHHTRLFPKGHNVAHRSGNVKPGTVVDSDITSPYGHDFFLCSQAGIQGTVRPAHYHVLVDENRFGSDAIQIMCYWMCYMQCRCTKPISVPAPANYAHLAAMRARLIAGEETDDETSSIGSGAGPSAGPAFAASQAKMYYV